MEGGAAGPAPRGTMNLLRCVSELQSSSSQATDDHQASPLNDHRIPVLVVSLYR
jgi:hypothetical protein